MPGRPFTSKPASRTCILMPLMLSTKRERMPAGRIAGLYGVPSGALLDVDCWRGVLTRANEVTAAKRAAVEPCMRRRRVRKPSRSETPGSNNDSCKAPSETLQSRSDPRVVYASLPPEINAAWMLRSTHSTNVTRAALLD